MASILKCKMCGGDIEVSQDMTVGTCAYCGSIMTLPKIDTEKKARMFNRANQYRLNNEFDKAYEAYKGIVDEDEQEAEAYWGMILSEYGVEYVEDPVTRKRIPTCHRTFIKPIQSTTNFELACKFADLESRFMYQDEAEELDRIQKAILSISSKEEPYDVFICYKETNTATGYRTVDSVLAQEIYYELNKHGIKVFFSRITLQDKLGKDYEPYIFAALSSAKVMLVVATSNVNVNSVWVKNEWSRYLQFMQEDSNKSLVPVYKDMQAYELPVELSKFQAQDMSKVGAIQDLAFSVQKLVSTENRVKRDDEIELLIKTNRERELREKKQRKIIRILLLLFLLFIIAIVTKKVIWPLYMYKRAERLITEKEYDHAISILEDLGDYKDSQRLLEQTENEKEVYLIYQKNLIQNEKYEQAIGLSQQGRIEDAIAILEMISEDKEVHEDLQKLYLLQFEQLCNSKDYEQAEGVAYLLDNSNDYIQYLSALEAYDKEQYATAVHRLAAVKDRIELVTDNCISEMETALCNSEITNIANTDVGEMVKYGKNNYIVLNKTDEKAYLVSNKSIGNYAFSSEKETNWSSSTLRKQLNKTVLNDNFSEAEQSKIVDIPNGSGSTDKLFLPSKEDITNISKSGWGWLMPEDDMISDKTYCAFGKGGIGYVHVRGSLPVHIAFWVDCSN